jgi:SAM-dependent methyltransferase
MSMLAVKEVVDFYTQAQKEALEKGENKIYPNLSLVRLIGRYFGANEGRLLDFGCGGGANLIHLLERGFTVDAVDTSPYSIETIKQRLEGRASLCGKVHLRVLDANAQALPYENEVFDFVVCASVFSLLSTKERIQHVAREFKRVLKPGGKVYMDINGANSEFAIYAEKTGEDLYIYRGRKEKDPPMNVVCLDSKEKFRDLISPIFEIDEVGITTHKFFEYVEEEYIICAHK